MRRSAACILILLLTCSLLAGTGITAHGRGQAVLTDDSVRHAFTHNPAFITSSDFSLHIPLQTRVHNVTGILGSDFTGNIKGIMSGDARRMATSILDILRSFNGRMDLLEVEEGLSFTLKGLGAGVFLRQKAITYDGSLGMRFALEMEAELDWGLGWRWDLDDGYTIAAGLVNRTRIGLRTSLVGVDTVVDFLLDPSSALDISLEEDIANSFDIGTYFRLPYGFSTSFVVRDIGPDGNTATIDTAFGWKGSLSILSLSLEAGLKGWSSIRDEVDLMKSLDAGLSLGITSLLSISAGIDGGYPSFGIDLELLCFAISAAWYWQDYGVVYGLAPRDVLSIEIALLID